MEEYTEPIATDPAERRIATRYEMEESASILLLEEGNEANQGSSFYCRVLDLSLTGCRLRTSLRFPGSAWDRAIVSFKTHGFALQFESQIQWTDGRQLIGVKFVNLTSQRRAELAEVIAAIDNESDGHAALQSAQMSFSAQLLEAQMVGRD